MAGEVALVGESRRGRCFGGLHALGNQPLRLEEPASDLITVRRRAVHGAEVTGEGEAVEAAEPLKFLRCNCTMRFGIQEIAGKCNGAARRRPRP